MRVAIKVIRGAIATPPLIEQFRLERQILARLEHPHIARILDGGVTEGGLPYVVMEFVDGVPITEYLDRKGATLAERLQLFCQVCSAVHHAHQGLVVHRDIKPGNILIASGGIPKLLDFGGAELLQADDPNGSASSGLMGDAMTPAYASPEQILGEKVTTGSDIYSLGVLLTELLAGRTPFGDIDGRIALEPTVHEVDPSLPSRLEIDDESASKRGTTCPKLRRALRGDLDAIAAKSMRREPGKRYPSANELSADIHRYLEGFPVEARASSWSYRALKYIRRRRYLVTAGVAVFFAIVACVIFALRRHQEAELRLTAIVANTRENQYTILDGIQDLPGTIDLRRQVIDKGLDDLGKVLKEAPDDERALLQFAQLLRRSAYLHYGRGRQSLGDSTTAIAQATQALDQFKRLALRTPSPVRLLDLAHVHAQLEDLLVFARRDFENARRLAGEEERILQEAERLGVNPQDLAWQRAHLSMRRARYALEQHDGQLASAQAIAAGAQFHAMKIQADAGLYRPDPDFQIYEAISNIVKAAADRSLGRSDQAVHDLSVARDVIERSYKLAPEDSGAFVRWLFLREAETETYASAHQCSAAFTNIQSLDIARDSANRDGQSVLGRELLAAVLQAYGAAELECGNLPAGRSMLVEAVEVYRTLVSLDASNLGWRHSLEIAQAALASDRMTTPLQ